MNERLVGMGRIHIQWFDKFIPVGYFEDTRRTVFAVGESPCGIAVTMLNQDTLTPETIPDDAVFLPQRFLMGNGKSVEDFNWVQSKYPIR